MKPNTNFKLDVKDIKLIEDGLHKLPVSKEIQDLLGRIHNQKNWYRPKDKIYVSG